MSGFLLLLFLAIGLACCISLDRCCCHNCLIDWLMCRICTQSCASAKGVCSSSGSKQGDVLLRLFGWLRPITCDSASGKHGRESSSTMPIVPSEWYVIQFQFGLLLWKRFTEIRRNVSSTVFYFLLPSIGLLVMLLLYSSFASPAFSNSHSSGVIEVFASPLLFLVAVQLTATSLVSEKCVLNE